MKSQPWPRTPGPAGSRLSMKRAGTFRSPPTEIQPFSIQPQVGTQFRPRNQATQQEQQEIVTATDALPWRNDLDNVLRNMSEKFPSLTLDPEYEEPNMGLTGKVKAANGIIEESQKGETNPGD